MKSMVPPCVFAYPTSIIKRSDPSIMTYFSRGKPMPPIFIVHHYLASILQRRLIGFAVHAL